MKCEGEKALADLHEKILRWEEARIIKTQAEADLALALRANATGIRIALDALGLPQPEDADAPVVTGAPF